MLFCQVRSLAGGWCSIGELVSGPLCLLPPPHPQFLRAFPLSGEIIRLAMGPQNVGSRQSYADFDGTQ